MNELIKLIKELLGEDIRIPQSEVLSIETRKGWKDLWEEEINRKEKVPQPEDKLQNKPLPSQKPEGVSEGALQSNPPAP